MHRHLVMFASLFLFLWAAISTGCSSKQSEDSSDSSAPSSKSASLFGLKEVTLPAGTVLTVRLASTVGSKTNSTGDHFNATIATPVESGGKVVLSKGAEALGRVVEAVPQGRFKGGAYSQPRARIRDNQRRCIRHKDKLSQSLPERQGETHRSHDRRRRRGRSSHRGSSRWRKGRPHWCSIGWWRRNRGSGLHWGEGGCLARRVHPQLQTHRSSNHQAVTVNPTATPNQRKSRPTGRLFHRKFQTACHEVVCSFASNPRRALRRRNIGLRRRRGSQDT